MACAAYHPTGTWEHLQTAAKNASPDGVRGF